MAVPLRFGFFISGDEKMKKTQRHLNKRISSFLKKDRMEFLDRSGVDSPSPATSEYHRPTIMDFFVGVAVLSDLLRKGMRDEKKQDEKTSNGTHYYTNPCLQKNLFVRFRELDSLLALDEHGITESLSLNGFTAHVDFVDRPLAVNRLIEISLKWPYKQSDPVKAIGRVEWVKKKDDKLTHEIGVRFTHMNDEDSDQYIRHFSDGIDVTTQPRARPK